MARIVLRSRTGYLLTNGQVTGHTIYLADGENPEDYVQISEDDFFSSIEDPASADDYQEALRAMGVDV